MFLFNSIHDFILAYIYLFFKIGYCHIRKIPTIIAYEVRNSYRSWDPCPRRFDYQDVWWWTKCCCSWAWSKHQYLTCFSWSSGGSSNTLWGCGRPRSPCVSWASNDREYFFSVWSKELFLSWPPNGISDYTAFPPNLWTWSSRCFCWRRIETFQNPTYSYRGWCRRIQTLCDKVAYRF